MADWTPAPRPSREEIRQITDHMNATFLKCRSQGHRWNDDAFYVKVPGSVPEEATRQMPCERCGTIRVDRMTRHRGRWELDGRYYLYADGYLAEPGTYSGLTRADYNDEVVRRDLGRT